MITAPQKILRKQHLCSSDMPAVLGIDPYRTAYDVYLEKIHEIDDDENENEAIEIGNMVEVPLILWTGKKLGSRVETDPDKLQFICKEDPLFMSHIDGILLDREGEGVEAKSSGMADGWGTPGTDDVPDKVIAQSMMHIMCAGLTRIHIPVLTGKFGLKRELYYVDKSNNLIEIIQAKGHQFWNDHVIPRIPPEAGVAPSLEILKRIRRVPASWGEVDLELVEQWEAAKKAKTAAEKNAEELLARVLAQLGDAEGARLSDGRELTFFLQSRIGVDAAKLQAEYPEVYNACVKQSSFRVARTRKGK